MLYASILISGGAKQHPYERAYLADIQHLRGAPIVEAIIDVRVEARPDFRGNAFLEIRDVIAGDYPFIEERHGVTFQLAFGSPQPQQQIQQHGIDGLFFRSADQKTVAQFRVDGFTLNRLAPYTSWGDLLPRALRLLHVYLEVTTPRSIIRVATRYINRIRLPSRRFEDYLTIPPRAVPGTGGAIAGFMEVALAKDDSGALVNFTQALDSSTSEHDDPSILLDIDAFRADSFEPNLDEVQRRLDVLHDLKNRVFFGALTDSAVRIFT